MRALQLTLASAGILCGLTSCSGSGDAATPANGTSGRVSDSSAGTVALGLDDPTPYRPTGAGGATLAGTVALQAAGADSVVRVSKDPQICGDSAHVFDVSDGGGSLANALVWVDGAAGGKPLPDVRRQTMAIEHCQFEPRVLATVTGSTINVLSRDRVVHDLRFYREGSGEPVAWVHTVDAGEVVPTEHVADVPGIVEARCTMHPWVRGYVAVFDHPYFAVTDEQGSFRIEGLPPGTYGVKVWHPGMDRPAEQRVVVSGGGVGRVAVTVALR